ncbi:MAG: tRNA (adenosine(37)-N6)-threonylcarbamoyltransferase complex dimerization subunit type 1 TsaB [Hasllibacter sp.]
MILGFDTSGPWLSAALIDPAGGALAQADDPMPRGQAERLFGVLEGCLDAAGAGWGDLTALAVGTGPGNFTGLRIAVAAARGVALSLGVPAAGVTGFAALSLGPDADGASLGTDGGAGDMVLLPAPRGQAYARAMRGGRAAGDPVIVDPADPPDAVRPAAGMRVLGHRAGEVAARFGAAHLTFEPDRMGLRVALIARRRLARGDAPERPRPLYVRPPDAAPPRDTAPRIVP